MGDVNLLRAATEPAAPSSSGATINKVKKMGFTEEEEDIAVGNSQVDDNLSIVCFVCTGNMSMERIIRAEPSDVLGFPTTSRNDAITLIQFRIPSPMIPSLLQSVEFTF